MISFFRRNDYVGPGPACAELERRLAEIFQVEHCVLTTSGTIALSLSALALGVKRVHVPAYGVHSVWNAFTSVGLEVVPHDICRTGHPGVIDAERFYGKGDAFCWVAFAGIVPSSLRDACRTLCNHTGADMIEDASCAWATPIVGDVGVISMSPHKTLGVGQGGAVLTNDRKIAGEVRLRSDHGRTDSGCIGGSGSPYEEPTSLLDLYTNLRFSDAMARLALERLEKVPQILEQRAITYEIIRPDLKADPAPLYNIVFVDDARAFKAAMMAHGVECRQQYRAIWNHPRYADMGSAKQFPNAHHWDQHAVFLPFGPDLTVDEARQIRRALDEVGHGR